MLHWPLEIHVNSWVGWRQQFCNPNWYESVFHIQYSIKITLVQCEAPAVFTTPDALPRKKQNNTKQNKNKPSAGHRFYWQLVNKLKKREAGAIFLPPLFLPLLRCQQLVLSQKSSWKWWTFQVLVLVEGIYITLFHSTLTSQFFLNILKFTGTESCQSSAINHESAFKVFLNSALWCRTLNRNAFPCWPLYWKLEILKSTIHMRNERWDFILSTYTTIQAKMSCW